MLYLVWCVTEKYIFQHEKSSYVMTKMCYFLYDNSSIFMCVNWVCVFKNTKLMCVMCVKTKRIVSPAGNWTRPDFFFVQFCSVANWYFIVTCSTNWANDRLFDECYCVWVGYKVNSLIYLKNMERSYKSWLTNFSLF